MKMTFIEAVILAIIGLIAVLFALSSAHTPVEDRASFGINGVTEVRCIGGFKHTVGDGGQARQMLDENGHGIRCN